MDPRFGAPSGSFVRSNEGLFPKVFGWMFAGLVMTAVIAWGLSLNENVVYFLAKNSVFFWGIVIAQLVVVFGLSFLFNRLSVFAATFGFFLYAALNGVTMTLVLTFFDLGTIFAAFFIAAGMFGVSAVFGYVTKRNLSGIGSVALMLVFGLILASIVNIFFLKSGLMSLIISYAIVVLFCIITAFDIQKIKVMAAEAMDEEMVDKIAIFGALMLYLDFIIIFKNLLYILGSDD
ncbi:Bax inhibitor-1/YccA family protein [Hazenella coriacea]|uniref:Modulator of FtsH protease n=1 Tax=Hazenella coriacea TaxID=1179467 RepID=A0A4R3L161_9BACL|nr:Bax inhibitor-1/YccA family protein [Hazenella coriacea]TCS93281.1 hypothetical protein EDD58_10896 [Hazenella coriacea]